MSYTLSLFGRPFLFYPVYMLTTKDIFLHMKASPVIIMGWMPIQLISPTRRLYLKWSPGCSSLLLDHTPPIILWLPLLFHLQEDEVHMKKVRCFLLPFLCCNLFPLLTFCIPKKYSKSIILHYEIGDLLGWSMKFSIHNLLFSCDECCSNWNFTVCLISKWIWLWLILSKK